MLQFLMDCVNDLDSTTLLLIILMFLTAHKANYEFDKERLFAACCFLVINIFVIALLVVST
jgi:hypothetical protein